MLKDHGNGGEKEDRIITAPFNVDFAFLSTGHPNGHQKRCSLFQSSVILRSVKVVHYLHTPQIWESYPCSQTDIALSTYA